MTAQRFDAVVIGAGPNGLAAAVRLAQSGASVLVVEKGDTIGGGCRSAELTFPGFVHDTCATIHALGAVAPALAPDHLGGRTIEWVRPEIPLAHPLDGGRAGVLHQSLSDTVDGLGRDGRVWDRVVGSSVRRWDDLSSQLLGPVLSVPRHPVALGLFGVNAVQPASWVAKQFHDEEGAALFGGCAAHAFRPLSRPLTSAFGVMLAATAHTGGWPLAAGGSQTVVDALAARLVELGGEIRTGVMVRSLADLPPSSVTLFDTDPRQLAAIAGDALPARYSNRLRRYRYGAGAFKVDYALNAPVPWTNEHCRRAGTVHVTGSFADLARAEADAAAGRMPERPFVLVVQATLADPSRAPEGKHTLWTYAHVPASYPGDATEAIEAQIERFAPGFRDTILGRATITPAGFEAYNPNYVGGDIAGGAHTAAQLVFRPTPALRSYRTPNPSLFLCSASTPPGGGVHGMCGWHAAGQALRRIAAAR